MTKAIVEYSPVGIVTSLAYDGKRLRVAMENNVGVAQAQHRFANNLSKAITGTMLMLVYKALAERGIISGSGDDDKDVRNFERNVLGIQPYSLNLNGKSFVYSSFQPTAGHMAMMADYVKLRNQKKHSDALEKILSDAQRNILLAIEQGGNTVYDQSLLKSFRDFFGQDGFASGMLDLVLTTPEQFVPTILSQIGQATDDTTRTAYVYQDRIQSMKNRIMAKIPGMNQTLEPVVDVLGREVKRNGGDNSLLNVFLNPSNVSSNTNTEAGKEIFRLYQKIGDKTIFPHVAPYYIGTGESKRNLTPQERTQYQKVSGQCAEKLINEALKNPGYRSVRDEDKAEILREISGYAERLARHRVLGSDMDRYQKAYAADQIGVSPVKYWMLKEEMESSGCGTMTEAALLLKSFDLPEEKQWKMLGIIDKDWAAPSEESRVKVQLLKNAGISVEDYRRVYTLTKDVKGIKGRNGKTIPLSAGQIKKALIDRDFPNLGKKQKYALYYAMGVSTKLW